MQLTGAAPALDAPPLRLTGASVGHDGFPVLAGIDLRIDAGEFVALLGANGSGKSTLIRAIFGLAQTLTGSIELFGTDRGRFADPWRVGYVPQRTSIAGALPTTVTEVVVSGRLPRLGLWRRLRAADHEAVRAAIAAVGLETLATQPVGELSGGQQHRVTIARALAAEPDFLVLDEPTAGVDAESQELLSHALADASRAGTTVLLIAHEVGPMAPLVTRVVCLGNGGVTFDGPASAHPSHAAHGHPDDHDGEHLHEHGDPPPRPGTGLSGW